MGRKENIQLIKDTLGLKDSEIRAMGVGPLMAQVAATLGMPEVLKCDADSGDTRQYTGDLEKDIKKKGILVR